jgi:hypothetical protein
VTHAVTTTVVAAYHVVTTPVVAVYNILSGDHSGPTASLSGPSSITVGESPTLTYSSTNATACAIDGVSVVGTSGSYTAPADIDVDTTYTLTCSGAGKSASSSKTVSVVAVDYGNLKGNPFNPIATKSSTGPSKDAGYYYIEPFGASTDDAYGLSATIYQADPRVQGVTLGSHSLGEIGIFNEQNNDFNTINGVEFGWIVGGKNQNSKAHLFVFDATNGYSDTQHGCYNGCGFVSESSIKPGHVVAAGTTANFDIQYESQSNRWNLYYNGNLFGYYPASHYLTYSGRAFTFGSDESTWGEVYNAGGDCIQMGNGIFGNQPGSAYISNFNINYGSASINTVLTDFAISNPYDYTVGNQSATGFSFGGPGGAGCN